MVDISDTIEDGYDSYDELFSDYIADRKVTPEKRMEAPLAAGERDNQAQAITHTFCSRGFASNRRRFVFSSASESKHHGSYLLGNNHDKDADELPWAQKYSPVSLNELEFTRRRLPMYRVGCLMPFARSRRYAYSITNECLDSKVNFESTLETTCSQRTRRKRQNNYVVAIVGQARFRCSRMEKSVGI